jgi:hypothetical protein
VDRKRAAGFLTNRLWVAPLLVAAGLLAAAAPAGLSRLHPARWLAAGADAPRALSTTFAECLAPPKDAEGAYLVEVGRAAFRAPTVLGGQAARAGLACESCHQGGRRNPDFFFPGLSGAPGTADVTSALFSSHRDDGIDNPKPIPDLSGPKAALKIGQDPPGALEHFIHGLVAEEFDGAEPPAAVLKGLAAYVRALGPKACPTPQRRPLVPADYVEDARRAVRVARAALERHDPQTAVLMIDSARWRLGLLDERYPDRRSADLRAALETADLDLYAAQTAVRAGDARASARLDLWLARSAGWARLAIREAPRSLFNPERLAVAAR